MKQPTDLGGVWSKWEPPKIPLHLPGSSKGVVEGCLGGWMVRPFSLGHNCNM